MKVSELFEAANVKQGDVVKIVYTLAQKHLKLPAQIKSDAKNKFNSTDEFWVHEIDNATSTLKKFIDYPSRDTHDRAHDAISYAVSDVVEKVYDHYRNAMNHEPGYKAPAIPEFDGLEIPYKESAPLLAAIPGYKEANKSMGAEAKSKEQASAKAHEANMTDDKLQKMADLIDANWEASYGPKAFAMVAKNPTKYDFKPGFAPQSEDDLVVALTKTAGGFGRLGALAEWSVLGKKVPPYFWDTLSNKKLMKKLASMSKHLRSYI